MTRQSFLGLLACISIASSFAINSLQEIPLDNNDRIVGNFILYTASESCPAPSNLAYREALPMSSDLEAQFFGTNPSSYGDCAAVCLEKGTHFDHLLHPLPQHVGKHLKDIYSFAFENCQQSEVGFLSYNENVADIYWMNNGRRVNVGTLRKGEQNTVWQVSYLGHQFQVIDSVNQKMLLNVTVQHNAIYPIGDLSSNLQVRDVERAVKETFNMEWHRAHRVTRTFTEYGFAKGRLPTDVWSSISTYYYNNKNNKVVEEWDSKGLYVNWWERNVYFIPMPWELKVSYVVFAIFGYSDALLNLYLILAISWCTESLASSH